MTQVIHVAQLQKTFRVGFLRKKVMAVRDVSFDVQAGEIFGIVGPNGAGKTTAIKMMIGLIRPDDGQASIYGINSRLVQSRRKLGYLPESPYFYEHLKISELLRFYGQLHGIDSNVLNRRIPELIERVGLAHATERRLSKFSKGMRQRAGLAQALINDPELIILDEPQTGLDPFGRKDVRDLIFDLKRNGKTVIFSSHILPDVEAVCDRVAIIHKGYSVAVGTLPELTGNRIKAFEVMAENVSELPVGVQVLQVQAGVHILEVKTDELLQKTLGNLVKQGARIVAVTSKKEDLEDVLVHNIEVAK